MLVPSESPVSRPLCLALVMTGAVGAVLSADPRLSSFLAGFGAGTGVLFVLSFLRNPRRGSAESGGRGQSPPP